MGTRWIHASIFVAYASTPPDEVGTALCDEATIAAGRSARAGFTQHGFDDLSI